LMVGDIKEKDSRLTNENDRRAMAIDLLWEIVNGRLTTAWIELVVASRTDSYLRESVSAANDRATEFIDQSFKELFPRPNGANPEYDLIPQLVCLILEAMALEGQTLNPELSSRILNTLKTFKF
jgi:hypothetical protein